MQNCFTFRLTFAMQITSTPGLHGYSVKFSPFHQNRFALVANQRFGIEGNGELLVFEGSLSTPVQLVKKSVWPDGLFDVCWSELNENICVSASGDGCIQVWNLLSQEPLVVIKEHQKEVYSIDWCHKNQKNLLVSGSWDFNCKIFDSNDNFRCLSTFSHHQQVVYSTVWAPQLIETFCSASGDGTICVWDIRTPHPQTIISAHDAEVLTCDWNKYDSYMIVSGSVDCSIRTWDIRNPRVCLSQLLGHNYAVRRVKTSPFHRGLLLSSSYDFTVRHWDLLKPQPFSPLLETFSHHSEFVYGLDLSTMVPGLIIDCSWDESVRMFASQLMSLAPLS